MAKINDLKKGLGSLKKRPVIAEEDSEKIVQAIHQDEKQLETPKKRGRQKTNIEPTIRYTIDIPKSTYKAIRHKVAEDGGTMKSFIMKTLSKELEIK